MYDLSDWLCHSLKLAFGSATEEQQQQILANIETVRRSPNYGNGEFVYKELLCQLPSEILNQTQLDLVQEHRSAGYGVPDDPSASGISEGRWVDPFEGRENDVDRYIGQWPNDIDLDLIREFYRQTRDIQQHDIDIQAFARQFPELVEMGGQMIDVLIQDQETVVVESNIWAIDRLANILNHYNRNVDELHLF